MLCPSAWINSEHWDGNIERLDLCAIITEISLGITLFDKILYMRTNVRLMPFGALEILWHEVTEARSTYDKTTLVMHKDGFNENDLTRQSDKFTM